MIDAVSSPCSFCAKHLYSFILIKAGKSQ